MKELIDRWEQTADRYELNASRSTNPYTSERLLASADTFKLCADELRRASQQPDPPTIGMKEKERFEKWAESKEMDIEAYSYNPKYIDEYDYADIQTQMLWECWKEASKQPDPPEITEPDRLLIALAENLKCIHRDIDGNHKYMVTLKTQPVLRDIKAYVRRRTNGPITDPQKPCEWCKVIDENHQNYCAWCGRRLNSTVNLYPSE